MASTSSFYASSADVLSKCFDAREDLSSLLDPETGFAPRLSKMCKQRLNDILGPGSDFMGTQEDVDMLRLEGNTWDLLQVLLSARKTEAPLPPKAKELLRQNPYTPTATLAQSIMKHSRLLNELVIVREWLHDSAPPPIQPEATTGYWKFTKLRLLQGLRTGNKKETETLVHELDPDSVNRDDGKVLSADDANYEKALANALYSFVRAGRLDDAIELCRKAHRPWRAASIRGSLLFQWRALSTEPRDDSADVDSDGTWFGNRQRKLWKSTCTRAALNPLLTDPDRALYAALAPSPATSAVLKAACRTWADHLWAQLSVICEGKEVDALARAGGGFWEGGGAAVERIGRAVAAGDDVDEDEEEEREDAEWEREVVTALESLKSVGVVEGPPATDPFHTTQLHIILNQTGKLLEDFAHGLLSGEFNPDQYNYTTLTRFFAHLCLFLRLIDVPVPADAVQVILEVYLQVLEEAGQREHIALYASALGEHAIERYALFLAGLDLSANLEERQHALHRAEAHGLDMVRVAQATAEKTIEKTFAALPRLKVTLPSVVTRETPLSDLEWMLIRSIEWTTFMEETYVNALEQANAIFRYFLGLGKVRAAKLLLTMLPKGLSAVDGPHEQRAEYAHYLQYFAIWDVLERVTESQAGEATYTTKGAKQTWLSGFKELIKDAWAKITELLITDWLISEEDARNATDLRTLTLVRIRRIYIPEFVIRLHALLMNTADKIEGNFKLALELANLVADSRYKLYSDFLGGDPARLTDYLLAVRGLLIRGLEGGGADPLRFVRS